MTRTATIDGTTIEAWIITLRKGKGFEVIVQRDGRFCFKHRYPDFRTALHMLDTLDLPAIASIF